MNKSDAQHRKGEAQDFYVKTQIGRKTMGKRRRFQHSSQVTKITKNLLVCLRAGIDWKGKTLSLLEEKVYLYSAVGIEADGCWPDLHNCMICTC